MASGEHSRRAFVIVPVAAIHHSRLAFTGLKAARTCAHIWSIFWRSASSCWNGRCTAFTLEHTAYGRLFTTTAAEVIVTWRRQFVSNAWRAMGSQSAFERSMPTDLIREVGSGSRREDASKQKSDSSIPFRCETVIGEPTPGASHLKDLPHLLLRQREIEDVDVFGQPFDL